MNENYLAACKTVVSRHYKIRLTSLKYLGDYNVVIPARGS
jgi:hypothetical protein